MKTLEFIRTMSDGFEVSVNQWIPDEDTEIKGVIQLCHGMMEHVLRYDRLGNFLAENGYVLQAHDQRGHGKTAQLSEEKGTGAFGKLAAKDGFNRVTEDLSENIIELKKQYPDKKLILLGHSFGSFVSQNYIETYGNKEIDMCILCGTSGPQPLASFGRFANALFRLFRGENAKSKLFYNIVFGGYNKRIPSGERKYGNEWLSKNSLNVELYNMDLWCGKMPVLSFFKDLLNGLCQIHSSANIKKIPQELPVFFIYGTEDPVGNYGSYIQKLISVYRKNGMKNVEYKAYETLRHELFNEAEWETVASDVLEWISKN